MSDYTPGPWEFDSNEYSPWFGSVFGDVGGQLVAEINKSVANGCLDANGYLTAAAPDLIEALKDAVVAIQEHGACVFCNEEIHHAMWCRAAGWEAAIAKARGEPPK